MIHADLGLQPHLMKPLIYTATPRTYFTAHQKAENQISQIHFKKHGEITRYDNAIEIDVLNKSTRNFGI